MNQNNANDKLFVLKFGIQGKKKEKEIMLDITDAEINGMIIATLLCLLNIRTQPKKIKNFAFMLACGTISGHLVKKISTKTIERQHNKNNE